MRAGRPVIAIDIGGTWVRAALVDSGGLHDVRRIATTDAVSQGSGDPHVVLSGLVDMVTPLSASGAVAVGVSATGPVDISTGSLYDVPNAERLSGLPIGQVLQDELGLPVTVDRDTNAALLAEQRHGAAAGLRDIVYLTLSTGVGGAVMLDGTLLRGADGVAGEIGHVVVRIGGSLCGCGRSGCLEAVASGDGLGRAATSRAEEKPDTGLGQVLKKVRASDGIARLTGRMVAEAAAAGDADALQLLAEARAAVVSAAVDLTNVFNPEVIVVGGSIARDNLDWLTEADEAVTSLALTPARTRARVVPAAIGEQAELLGAALLVPSQAE